MGRQDIADMIHRAEVVKFDFSTQESTRLPKLRPEEIPQVHLLAYPALASATLTRLVAWREMIVGVLGVIRLLILPTACSAFSQITQSCYLDEINMPCAGDLHCTAGGVQICRQQRRRDHQRVAHTLPCRHKWQCSSILHQPCWPQRIF